MSLTLPGDLLAPRAFWSTSALTAQDISNATMTYFYDEDICFTRLGFPHMLSATNAPPGTGSIQAEVYFSENTSRLPDRPTTGSNRSSAICDVAAFFATTTRSCSRRRCCCDTPTSSSTSTARRRSKTVHGYLDDLGIAYCGRYGDWGYMWTDESFISGENAAQKALEKLVNLRCK